tara:strand:- start:7339 stop:7806 length:468 start_codon:yes stop_codon:yes gene_type:complete
MANVTVMKQDYIRSGLHLVEQTVHITLDFDTNNVGAADTVDIADLPVSDGSFLVPTEFLVQVETADGETATADFGLKPTSGSSFTADPNGLNDAVDLDSAAVSQGVVGTDAQMGARIDIDNGATLYMTADHALEDGKAHVTLKYFTVDSDADFSS